ncbi:hypothetical protein BASA81_005590 [Batrachochytrium salamandrivorans]|nr:hypothetical protein BASA81_005590 [Batrachochytrium salamandrivorans]
MGKRKPTRSSSEVQARRQGEVQLSPESKRVLEKFLSKHHGRGLGTIVYESSRKDTVRVVLLPANKLVVVTREQASCRTLLQQARKTLGRKGLNQAFLMLDGQSKQRLVSTWELPDDSRVMFEIGEYEPVIVEELVAVAATEEDEEDELVEEEDEFVQEETEDCFARARAAIINDDGMVMTVDQTLPILDYLGNRRKRIQLPIDEFERELVQAVWENSVTILSAPTGSGKSTRLAQFVLEHVSGVLGQHCNIVITEPRRIAAMTLCDRVSEELANPQVAGFSVRTETKASKHTKLLFCTVGVLLKRLSHDQSLAGVTHVFVDEAHEQDVLTDLLLIFLRDLLVSGRRSDLKVCILSATMKSQHFADYFGGFACKQIAVPGSMFPVDFYHLDQLDFLLDDGGRMSKEPEQIARCVEHYILTHPNDLQTVLVFVCGRRDILQTMARLRATIVRSDLLEILPLHSQLSNEDQRRVFAPAKPLRRRIVVSTNVAETSVTIPNVGLVVDCGMFKESTYDSDRRVQELRPTRVSKSAMMQRRGRAGRTSPGTCYHLFPSTEELEDTPVPGMQKDSLESAMVFLKAAKPKSNAFAFFATAPNPPAPAAVACTLEDLVQLGVLQGSFTTSPHLRDETTLTALGFHLAKLGTTCRVGKLLILGCLFNCIEPVLTIAAALDGKSPFNSFALKPASLGLIRQHFGEDDFACFLTARQVYLLSSNNGEQDTVAKKRFISNSAMELNEKIRADFVQDLTTAGFLSARNNNTDDQEFDPQVLRLCLAAGLFPHLGKVSPTGVVFSTGQYELEKSFLDPNSTITRVTKGEFFVYHNRIRLGPASLSLQRICVIHPVALVLFAGGLLRSKKQSQLRKFATLKLGQCWTLQCRNRDAAMLLELRKLVSESLLQIYETHDRQPHRALFQLIKMLVL